MSPYRRTRETLEAMLTAFMDDDGNVIPWHDFQQMEVHNLISLNVLIKWFLQSQFTHKPVNLIL